MKKKNFLIPNNILIGLCSIFYLIYDNLLSLAAIAAASEEGLEIGKQVIEIVKLVSIDWIIVIILYILFTILNYIFVKKQYYKTTLFISITSTIILFFIIFKIISMI